MGNSQRRVDETPTKSTIEGRAYWSVDALSRKAARLWYAPQWRTNMRRIIAALLTATLVGDDRLYRGTLHPIGDAG
jgi:hypothetical protein